MEPYYGSGKYSRKQLLETNKKFSQIVELIKQKPTISLSCLE